ncbi:MAG: UDP-glucose/GDP-mannose dehydrogenase family protein [Candidatus Pacebacteria bacterium]|nr:UDP-glucose/GDP-mannose dehydrogenase family protein [Candidatus Paceibacterota bacterium]
MNISVFGTGYVGLVTGVCLANLGHNVVCYDIDKNKIKLLNCGKVPFFEPQVEKLVIENSQEGKINFTTDIKIATENCEIIFIAVGTPQKESGKADLSYVKKVAEQIGKNISAYTVIVNKSTVPIGTGNLVRDIIQNECDVEFDIISNPEFLREGSAVDDFLNPERIIIGSDSQRANFIINKLYKDFSCPIINTDIETAEMIKYASNAFLATKISFVNEIANICEKVGANIDDVSYAMGLDSRIGNKFLNAGIGYGGSCFPKDIKALSNIALSHDYDFELLKSVIKVNTNQRLFLINKIKKLIGNLEGKKICVWGIAFKPNTDDIRESAAIDIMSLLHNENVIVNAYDPQVNYDYVRNHKKITGKINLYSDKYDALENCDALIIATEWEELRKPDFDKIDEILINPIIVDGRNIYSPVEMKKLGFKYVSVGRKEI